MGRHLFVILAVVSIGSLLLMLGSVQTGLVNYRTPRLAIGQTLGEKVPSLSESSFAEKSIVGSRKARYVQSVVLSKQGLFEGGKLEYSQDIGADVVTFVDSVFLLTLSFGDGLVSRLEGSNLSAIHGKHLFILGSEFEIAHSAFSNSELRLVLQGPVRIDFTDVVDDSFSKVRINGVIADARVRMKAWKNNDEVIIGSIEYIVDVPFPVSILPGEGIRGKLRIPDVFLVPDFDITYSGLSSAKAAIVFTPSGRGYDLTFVNNRGILYKMPFIDNDGSLYYGKGVRRLRFAEDSLINFGDYFVVASRNDINGITRIMRLEGVDAVQAVFSDISGGRQVASVNDGSGRLWVDGVEHSFVVSGNSVSVDLDADGIISSVSVPIIAKGGTRLVLGSDGSQITVQYTAPARLFEERVAETIAFTFSNDAGRTDVRTSLATFTDAGGIDRGMTDFGTAVVLDRRKGNAVVSISPPLSQAKAVVGVGG